MVVFVFTVLALLNTVGNDHSCTKEARDGSSGWFFTHMLASNSLIIYSSTPILSIDRNLTKM